MIDFAELEAAWRSPANTPSEAANAYVLRDLNATLKQRRDSLRGFLIFAAVALGLVLVRIAIGVIGGQGDAIDWSREWALAPLLAVPIILLAVIWRQRHAQMSRFSNANGLVETFRALLADNAFARTRIKLIAFQHIGILSLEFHVDKLSRPLL